MIFIGFFAVWVLYYGVFTLYMNNIIKEGKETVGKRDFGSYMMRLYGIGLTNVFIALSIVIMPLIAMIAGVHVYWIGVGILYTLVIHFFYTRMMIWGEVLIVQVKENERVKGVRIRENRNYQIAYRLVVVLTFLYFLLIAFNAFDILPIQAMFLPPIMPLYYHILLEFITLLGVFLLSALTLLVIKKRLDSFYQIEVGKKE